MAEIEFSAMSKQYLDRRIGSIKTLKSEVLAWTKKRNKAQTKINWQFTKEKARDKFERFYQTIRKD
jgi:bacillopeptidase F (M6 metalloprotease family)